jgi:hypothetical protein
MDFPSIHSLLLSISSLKSRYSVVAPTVLALFLPSAYLWPVIDDVSLALTPRHRPHRHSR